jgi:hypothetical protein
VWVLVQYPTSCGEPPTGHSEVSLEKQRERPQNKQRAARRISPAARWSRWARCKACRDSSAWPSR